VTRQTPASQPASPQDRAEPLRRVRMADERGRLSTVQVPAFTRAELETAVRATLREGGLTRGQAASFLAQASELNPDGTRQTPAQKTPAQKSQAGAQSSRTPARGARTRKPRGGR
jgi:hypothetical protein